MEDVGVQVGSKDFRYWSELELTLSLDTFATLSFRAPFEPTNPDFRSTFRPFSFSPLKVLLEGTPLFTGCMVGVHPEGSGAERKCEITGYALPGVLNDCNAHPDKGPYEFKKVTLKTIAESLAGPFGLSVRFQDEIGAKFGKAKLENETEVFKFLCELAKQRGLVFTSDPDGVLLCWKSVKVGHPVARLTDDSQPVTKIEGTFNPQEYFSQITGRGRARGKHRSTKHTEKNPYLSVLRPHNFMVPDTDPAEVPAATRAELGRMFANVASWTISDLPTWRDPNGELWQPNTTVTVNAPSAMIYRDTELLIRSVTLKQDAEQETADMNVVLPGAFSSEVPSFMPWDEPNGF